MKKLIIFTFLLSFTIVSAQKKANKLDDDSVTPLKSACACIEKIDLEAKLETRLEEVKTCINEALSDQRADALLGYLLAAHQSQKDTLSSNNSSKVDSLAVKKNVTITFDPNLGYNDLERDLLENCKRLKTVIRNVEKSAKSYSDDPKAIAFYNEGLEVYNTKNWDKALSLFEKALKEDTNFPFAWDMKGITHRQMGDFKQAVSAYKKSLKIDPNGKMPLQNLPVAYTYLEEHKKAASAYEELLARYPGDPEGYYGLGQCGIKLNDDAMAIDNMMIAYNLYVKTNSPYKQDAVKILSVLYNEMNDKGQLETFLAYARKHDINFTD